MVHLIPEELAAEAGYLVLRGFAPLEVIPAESREDSLDLVFVNTDETIVFQMEDTDEIIDDVVDILQDCNIIALADVSAS